MTNFDNYKFRCSALGNIVTKSGKLTDGAITYLTEVFIGEIYGVRKEAYGKALDKGVACEQDGFKLLTSTLYPEKFIKKIVGHSENEYIRGTADCIPDEIIYDIKNAYDRFTFGKADLTHLYEWQLRGYMFLYDKPIGRLFYCLNNMPDYMISEEEKSMFYKQRKWISFDDPDYIKACDELRLAHNYDNMPIEARFKIWQVERSKEHDDKIISCVKQAREYLNKLLKEHNDLLDFNRQLITKAHSLAA